MSKVPPTLNNITRIRDIVSTSFAMHTDGQMDREDLVSAPMIRGHTAENIYIDISACPTKSTKHGKEN